jgi:NhaA family Na+:H+ antiporter
MSININNRKTLMERLSQPLLVILRYQSTSGIIIFLSVAIAMLWANSQWKDFYHQIWETHISFQIGNYSISESIHTWINDGLMAVFFFSVGLEIKREILGGELSSVKKAMLPISAAIGGMIVPSLIFLLINLNSEGVSGWGIPMATDIAFSIGVLSLLGNKVPLTLKVFLVALAIVDDVGGVLIIALFYTSDIAVVDLFYAAAFFGILVVANYLRVRNVTFYTVVGVGGLWLAFFFSGIHPTIAGILAAFTIPGKVKINNHLFTMNILQLTRLFKKAEHDETSFVSEEELNILETIKQVSSDAETPLQKVEYFINPFVAYVILPLFALANTGIHLHGDLLSILFHPVGMGIGLGLIIGKFIGVVGASKLMVKLNLAELPKEINWKHIYGVGLLAGIGFTMSLFISELAYSNTEILLVAKISILITSILAGLLAWIYLKYFTFYKLKN